MNVHVTTGIQPIRPRHSDLIPLLFFLGLDMFDGNANMHGRSQILRELRQTPSFLHFQVLINSCRHTEPRSFSATFQIVQSPAKQKGDSSSISAHAKTILEINMSSHHRLLRHQFPVPPLPFNPTIQPRPLAHAVFDGLNQETQESRQQSIQLSTVSTLFSKVWALHTYFDFQASHATRMALLSRKINHLHCHHMSPMTPHSSLLLPNQISAWLIFCFERSRWLGQGSTSSWTYSMKPMGPTPTILTAMGPSLPLLAHATSTTLSTPSSKAIVPGKPLPSDTTQKTGIYQITHQNGSPRNTKSGTGIHLSLWRTKSPILILWGTSTTPQSMSEG